MGKHWTLEEKWNDSLKAEDRPLTVRTHIYASEIGKNHWERYQKMNAVPYTNPLDDRVLRKFSAGIWFEDQIGYVLKKIGILKEAQLHIEIPECAEHLRVSGRIDFIAGGVTNWNEARERIRMAEFPESISRVSFALIDQFEREHAEGLEEKYYEVKSINSQVFWSKKDYLEEAYFHHIMQIYSYLRAKKAPLGALFYISKDDLTVKEIEVHWPDEKLEAAWLADVTKMSEYIRTKTEPPKPEFVTFDKRKKLHFQKNKVKHTIVGSYDTNWEIAWSPYLTLLTGCKTVDDWEDLTSVKSEVSEKNAKLKEDFISKLTS